MVDLRRLSQATAYAQTSGSGFGTRMLCRPLDQHAFAPVEESMWLTGLRRANVANINTNPVVNVHMRSPGGFIEKFAGLRDGGDVMFEACWKNDAPLSRIIQTPNNLPVTMWDAATDYSIANEVQYNNRAWRASQDNNGIRPSTGAGVWTDFTMYTATTKDDDFQSWQAPKENDAQDRKSFFHSLFYDRDPYEVMVIPPQWTLGIIAARGYSSMAGPFPHELEGPINFQGTFAISGIPMPLRGTKLGRTDSAVAIAAGAVATIGGVAIAPSDNRRYRAVSQDKLYEVWSSEHSTADAAAWGEAGPLKIWNIFEYEEDEGFGDAF